MAGRCAPCSSPSTWSASVCLRRARQSPPSAPWTRWRVRHPPPGRGPLNAGRRVRRKRAPLSHSTPALRARAQREEDKRGRDRGRWLAPASLWAFAALCWYFAWASSPEFIGTCSLSALNRKEKKPKQFSITKEASINGSKLQTLGILDQRSNLTYISSVVG